MSLFSNNKLIINLDKTTLKPGESIKWTLSCAFLEPTKIDGLSMNLIWRKKYSNYSAWNGSVDYNSNSATFYQNKKTILGAWTYNSQDIPFEYVVPVTILPKKFSGFGKIGNLPEWAVSLINALVTLMGMRWPQYTVEFSLVATADIPWGIDITESVYISIEQNDSNPINIPITPPPSEKNEITPSPWISQ